MARKSRKNALISISDETVSDAAEMMGNIPSNNLPTVSNECFCCRAGLYARLSLESEANRDRNTIENQMELLRSFVLNEGDIETVKEYFDISMTGTNFDRPGFNEMMQDIREGRINCVIVKDLSRLGRNYVDAGNYIERVFPFFGVRFIAVNDNYDSEKESGLLMLGLSNIFNEYYSRDISKKIRSSEKASWEKGECVAGCLAYGLMKDPADKHRIIPDLDVSGNVVKIFNLFAEHKSYSKVARIMTEKGILSPRSYFAMKRTGSVPEGMDIRWIGASVKEILKNRYYIGDSVHGKARSDVFGKKKKTSLPESDWMIVENTHEAIISEELYYEVQDIIAEIREKHKRRMNRNRSVASLNLLKGKIFCADCGHKMYIRKQKNVRPEYICGGNSSYRKVCGSSHSIIACDVEDAVMKVIHAHIVASLDKSEFMRALKRKQETRERMDAVGSEIKRINKEIGKLREHKRTVYSDFSDHLIDEEQYDEMIERDKQAEELLAVKLNELVLVRGKYSAEINKEAEWDQLVEAYKNKRKLSKELVDAFVDRVDVHKDKSIDIRLIYDDFLQGYRELQEKRGDSSGK